MDELQVLGTIPRNTRGSTREEAKEPIKLGKNQRTDRTVPQRRGGLSAVQKSPPTKKHLFCLNSPQNGLRGVADCPSAADCPPNTRRLSENEQSRNSRTRKNTFPKSSPDLPNGWSSWGQDLGEMICVTRWWYAPKLLASNSLKRRESRITRIQPRTKSSTQTPSNRGGFPAFEGSRSSTKRHKALTHDPLKEIRRKTLSNPRNQPKNENTKEAPKRPTEITTPNLIYNRERFVQGLACLLNIHSSLKISPWSSQASPMEILGKIGKPNELGFREMTAILSPLSIYGDSRKTKIPLRPKLGYKPTKGTLGICLCSTIGRMPGNRPSRSLDASLAIPTRVLCFEASRRARIPSPPAEPPVLVLWLNQVTWPVLWWTATNPACRLQLWAATLHRLRSTTSFCFSCHHAACTWPRWPPGPSSQAYLSLHSSEAPQGIDLWRPLFTCTNANQAATCTCNT
jgi:hypothetical protein